MFDLSKEERILFRSLSTPGKIQDYLDTLSINQERSGDTCLSPRRVIRERHAHCIEGAMLGAAALWYHGQEPLILDLKNSPEEFDHAVALFKHRGYWGALSKTNHNVLRYRDPVYRTLRELALSYFHEYFLPENGKKTLRSYSRPFSLKRFGTAWVTAETDVWEVPVALDNAPHYPLVPKGLAPHLRRASLLEQKMSQVPEWPEQGPRFA